MVISFSGFKKAERLFNACADEGFFIHSPKYLDCDFCPARRSCLRFWDNYVVVQPTRLEEKERYLNMVEQGLEEIKRRKHERKAVSFWFLAKVG